VGPLGRLHLFRRSYTDHVVVDTFSRLDAPVAQPVAHVVECVVLLDVHHAVGDTVSECVWRYVVGIAATTVDEIGLDVSGCSCNGTFCSPVKTITFSL